MKTWLFTILSVAFLFPFASQISAQVVINEISPASDPEWVELYNNSGQSVNLEGWEVSDDDTGSGHFGVTITQVNQVATISAYGFLVVEAPKGKLADTGDLVTLYDDQNNQVDSTSYSSTSDDKTHSRLPDGTGNFVANTSPTKNAVNQPLPTATPIPTPTSSPTPTSTPTPTPPPAGGPTPTPTPTVKPSPTPTKTPTPTKAPPPAGGPVPFEGGPLTTTESESTALVLSADTQLTPPPAGGPTPTPKPTQTSSKRSIVPLIAIILGSVLLLVALFFFFNSRMLK